MTEKTGAVKEKKVVASEVTDVATEETGTGIEENSVVTEEKAAETVKFKIRLRRQHQHLERQQLPGQLFQGTESGWKTLIVF